MDSQIFILTGSISMTFSIIYSVFIKKDSLSNTLEITWITLRVSCLMFLDQLNVLNLVYNHEKMINYMAFLLVTLNIQKGLGYDLLTLNIFASIYKNFIQNDPKKMQFLFILNSYVFCNYWIIALLYNFPLTLPQIADTISNISEHFVIPISVMGFIYLRCYADMFTMNYTYYDGFKICLPILSSYLALAGWYIVTKNRGHNISRYKDVNLIPNGNLLEHIHHMRTERTVTELINSIKFNDNNKLIVTNPELIKLISRDLEIDAPPSLIITEKDVWILLELRVYQIKNPNARLFSFESVREFIRLMNITDTDYKDLVVYKSFLNEVFLRYVEIPYSVLPIAYIKYVPIRRIPLIIFIGISTILISIYVPNVSYNILSSHSYITSTEN